MQAYDVLMLIVLALAIVWGAWKGLVWQIASILSIILSYFVALRFRQPLANIIEATPPWNMFLAMLILFLGTGLVVWLGFNLISEFLERVKLKEFDRQLGGTVRRGQRRADLHPGNAVLGRALGRCPAAGHL